MKRYSNFLLLAALLGSVQTTWARPRFDGHDEWGRATVQLPSGRKPLAEMLTLYSQSAKANIFADVSGIPIDQPITSPADFETPPTEIAPHSRRSEIGRITFQGGLWLERSTFDTYVLWPKPDLNVLAKLILEQQQKFDEAATTGNRAAAIAALKDFLKQEKGWKLDAETVAEKNVRGRGIEGALALSDFPSTLQKPLQAELVSSLRTLNGTFAPVVWTDDYWKDTRIRLYGPLRMKDGKRLTNPYGMPRVDVVLPPDPQNIIKGMSIGRPQQIKVNWQHTQGPEPTRLASQPSVAGPSICAPADGPAPAPILAPTGTEPGFTFDPTLEESLKKTISLSHQSVAATAVVADMSRQSGIDLKIEPDVAPNAKVIALSEGMTLWSAMQAMARLCSGHWEKQANSYVLRSDQLDELHTLMAHMGERAFYRFALRNTEESAQIGDDLASQILDACDLEQLESKQGALFSSLPADLQQSVMTFVREEHIGELIVSQQRVDDALAANLQFRFMPLPANAPQFFGAFFTGGTEINSSGNSAILAAYTPDGRYIARLFPEFRGAGATPFDEMQEKQALDVQQQNLGDNE